MADGNPQSRYVKLTREQEAPTEDITPGELNQPIQIPQVLLSLPGLRIFFAENRKFGFISEKNDNVGCWFSVVFCVFFYLVAN